MASANIPPGFYSLELNKTKWEVRKRYKLFQPMGVTAYGQVVSFLDTSENAKRAITKMARPFQSTIQAKGTYRDLRLLKHMHHKNVISLLDVFTPQTTLETFDDVYLVTHLMGTGLNNIMGKQAMSDDTAQFLVYQILRGLKYIHSAGILHKELKPSNIAVNEELELTILNLGLARHAETKMPGYVSTNWYKAPEIAFNWMSDSQTADIWSVGCIMAEILTGKPLFPASDDVNHLTRILSLRGTPSSKLIDEIKSVEARDQIASLPKWKKKPLNEEFVIPDSNAVDLLERMLDLDAEQRINAEAALAHPYLVQYADPDNEPTAEKFDDTFEGLDLEISE